MACLGSGSPGLFSKWIDLDQNESFMSLLIFIAIPLILISTTMQVKRFQTKATFTVYCVTLVYCKLHSFYCIFVTTFRKVWNLSLHFIWWYSTLLSHDLMLFNSVNFNSFYCLWREHLWSCECHHSVLWLYTELVGKCSGSSVYFIQKMWENHYKKKKFIPNISFASRAKNATWDYYFVQIMIVK